MISLFDSILLIILEFVLLYSSFSYMYEQEKKRLNQKIIFQKKEADKKTNDLQLNLNILEYDNNKLKKSSCETQAIKEKIIILEKNLIDTQLEKLKLEQRVSQLQHELYCARKRSKKLSKCVMNVKHPVS